MEVLLGGLIGILGAAVGALVKHGLDLRADRIRRERDLKQLKDEEFLKVLKVPPEKAAEIIKSAEAASNAVRTDRLASLLTMISPAAAGILLYLLSTTALAKMTDISGGDR